MTELGEFDKHSSASDLGQPQKRSIFFFFFFFTLLVVELSQREAKKTPPNIKMKTTLQRASELLTKLGNGQIHTMTMERPLKVRKSSELVGTKRSKTQVRVVAYENTAKVLAKRDAGFERSETPSGYEITGLENFKGKVLRGVNSRDLHLNLAVVRGLGSEFIVDGGPVEVESIAHELLSSETKKSTPKVEIDPATGETLEVQKWMRPKVANIVGLDLVTE